MFKVIRHPNYSQFIIRREGTGSVPRILSGLYTHMKLAQDAINRYIKLFEEEKGRLKAIKKKKQESLDKPLGFTQKRNKSNVEKPGTSRK
ncbi:MAG: hypothetical protein JKY53_14770 [Flavobacteriales bacterium]|nr:hypothetical protein [Flavobacteriales bacterium]